MSSVALGEYRKVMSSHNDNMERSVDLDHIMSHVMLKHI